MASVPYRFFAYQQAGTTWKSYTTLLTAVPIEYMSSNASAFADGDEVIVEFTGQDFAAPKVIGFKANPAGCEFGYYVMFGFTQIIWPPGEPEYPEATHVIYDALPDSWKRLADLPSISAYPSSYADWEREHPGWGAIPGYHFVFGGHKMAPFNIDYWTWAYPTLGWDLGGHVVIKTAYRYSRSGETWAQVTSLTTDKKCDMSCFTLSGKIHLVGGTEFQINNLTETVFDDHEKYDPGVDSYSIKAPKKVCRASYWGLNDLGYIFGGNVVSMLPGEAYDKDNQSRDLSEYNPDENVWSAKQSHTSVRFSSSCFSLPGNGYAFGGSKDAGYTGDLDEWNKDSNAWSVKANAPLGGICYGQRPAVGQGAYAYIWVYVTGLQTYRWTKETNAWSVQGTEAPPTRGQDGARALI